MNNHIKTILFSFLVFSIISCEKEKATDGGNIERIYAQTGRPVKTRTLEKDTFVRSLSYISALKGTKESSGSSLIADAVEDVLVKVGDYVEKDQPIVLFPKTNPSANYYQAEAGFKAAKQAFDRVESLYKKNGVSRQTYDDARTQYEVQSANWKNVQKLVQVTAPISGYITRLNVSPSDNVSPGTELFTVSNYDRLTATILVNDRDIREFAIGQNVTAEWEDEKITGTVTQVDLSKNTKKKAFTVDIILENQTRSIPSGVTADIAVDVETDENSIILHRNEFLTNGGEHYVFIDENGYARKRSIEIGKNQGMYYRITAGLEKGDRIITEGLNLVRENEKIRNIDESDPVIVNN